MCWCKKRSRLKSKKKSYAGRYIVYNTTRHREAIEELYPGLSGLCYLLTSFFTLFRSANFTISHFMLSNLQIIWTIFKWMEIFSWTFFHILIIEEWRWWLGWSSCLCFYSLYSVGCFSRATDDERFKCWDRKNSSNFSHTPIYNSKCVKFSMSAVFFLNRFLNFFG